MVEKSKKMNYEMNYADMGTKMLNSLRYPILKALETRPICFVILWLKYIPFRHSLGHEVINLYYS